MGLLELLLVVFVVLKLVGYIDWSWWWVLSPLYPAVLVWVGLICVVVFGGISVHGSLRSWR
ncbi:MAG TPA: hypothetical protein VGD87_00105 [Archangium sp.]